ncbi:hypothetical protein ACFQ0D_35815 [Micromonospora zhanjiangensis]
MPHFANLPFASLQRTAFAAAFGGHLMNFPVFASLQGAANAGAPTNRLSVAAATNSLRI